MILVLTLAGILTTQPVEHVYFAPNWFAYSIGNVERDCPDARVSLTGTQASVTAAVCSVGLFRSGLEQ